MLRWLVCRWSFETGVGHDLKAFGDLVERPPQFFQRLGFIMADPGYRRLGTMGRKQIAFIDRFAHREGRENHLLHGMPGLIQHIKLERQLGLRVYPQQSAIPKAVPGFQCDNLGQHSGDIFLPH